MVVTIDTAKHLTENEIALFIEGAHDDIDARRVSEHLRACEQCRADFQFAVRTGGMFAADPESFAPRGDLIETGMSAVESVGCGGAQKRALVPPDSGGRKRRALYFATTAIAIASLTAVVWLLPRRSVEPEAPPSSVLALMVEISERSLVVFPRVENLITTPRHAYRSDAPIVHERASEVLSGCAARYEGGTATRDDIFWLLAGFLADGQSEAASDLVEHALEQYPADGEFRTMAGLVAYFDGRLDEAERRLRHVVERDPNDAVALLDLAVVLEQLGKEEEADMLLKRVIQLRPGTPLAERAQYLMN